MLKKRIAIAGFQHETNTFCPFPATLSDFEMSDSWPAMTRGEDIIEVFSPLNIPIGGFIKANIDWDLIPIVWAAAEPAGHVSKQAFDTITAIICDGISRAGAIDGVYLDLHGAMVSDEHQDGETEIVKRVRQVIGDELPLVCSFDFHANISEQFIERVSALTIFRHYPHTDMAHGGERAAALMKFILDSGKPLFKSFRQIDYLVPLSSQGTTRYPFNELYAGFRELENDGVLSVDAAAGFTAADIYNCGPSVIALGTDEAAVSRTADILEQRFIQAEEKIVDELLSPEKAITASAGLLQNSPRPVVLADVQDNPGAGGTSDTTAILESAIALDCVDAIVGVVFDPSAVQKSWQAGVGANLELSLGNAYPISGTKGFLQDYHVVNLSDDFIHCTGQVYGGVDADLGAMAVLRATGIEHSVSVVLSSKRFQCLDLAVFRQMGLAVESPQVIVVKSTIHFLADFEPIAQKVLFVEAPGVFPCKLDPASYKNLRSGVRVGSHL